MKILVVDDTPLNLQVVEKILKKEGYEIHCLANGNEALSQVAVISPDLILLDVNMPEIDGYTLCKKIKEIPAYKSVPVIFLTARNEEEDIQEAFNAGGVDYIVKPFRIPELLSRVHNHLEIKRMHNSLETLVTHRTIELKEALLKLEATNFEILKRLSQAAEFRDNETADHLHRMSRYSVIIGKEIGFDEEQCHMLLHASVMHDVGKIGIPDNILLKPGKLTPEEFDNMKRHPLIGFKLLDGIDSPLLKMAATIALSHHEKYDGSGYPRGLSGEEIPLVGRIVALADVFDALSTSRPYKEAWPTAKVVEHINNNSGTHFDPKIVKIFNDKLDAFLEVKSEFTS